ncbi:Panacea domain-containing protein [Sphingomonas qilianensis]|uniref:Type II toxin-antitoxin system antitoxin SocA domain-containing protein n=1 Tax=Sphingomonas qilianensis TaxID=1736690 RepID=A0ABU9XT02_9SPHN
MTAYPPLAVANAVLDEARVQGKSLTIMQLLKLVYIAHGWSLALLKAPLVDQQPEAWQHGPVFPSVYREFRRFGSQPIVGNAVGPFGMVPTAKLSSQQSAVIQSVVKSYGDMHAFSLSRITHEPGTPWSQTYRGGLGNSDEIPNAIISEHYTKLADERQPKA